MLYELTYCAESFAQQAELHKWITEFDTPEISMHDWLFELDTVGGHSYLATIIEANDTHETMLLLKYSHILRVSPLLNKSYTLITKRPAHFIQRTLKL